MRLALDWLAEFIDLPPPKELVDRLNLGGFEDAAFEETGPDLSGVRVGHVLERAAHPNADRLSLCRVDLGDGEPLEIVCGAPNVATGQKVAVAPIGTRLPDGTKLKRSKIRGVVSQGMICSRRELGLGDEHEGILVLADDAPVGAPLAEAFSVGARVLQVGVTPNRGDAASVLGVAREVRAFFGGALRLPETAPPEEGVPAAEAMSVTISAPADCYRYVARVVRGVRVEPSPKWLVERLAASDIRAINNVVDVTNLVLFEFGQPLHAFDLARVGGGRIDVRRARPGEKLATLDGENRALDSEDLVIADADGAVALAGVMGGAHSEVGATTTDVLIESAHFHPTRVRLTARRHGLHSEASYRFERGVDREGVQRAADRAARLIAELAGGAVAPGAVQALGDAPPATEEVLFDVARANRLLGTALTPGECAELLGRVDVDAREGADGVLRCRVPSHRNDLHAQHDLTEDLARIYGYDRIPTTLPEGRLEAVRQPAGWTLAEASRDALAGAGLLECVNLPFLAETEIAALRLPPDDPRGRTLAVLNPIKEEEPRLRSLLLPSLLRVARQNLSRQAEQVQIFELSRVFRPVEGRDRPDEPLLVGALITRGEERRLWQPATAPPLYFQVKGIAERLLNRLGYVASLRGEPVEPFLHPEMTAAVEVENRVIGAIGEVHPAVAAGFGIDVSCAALEIDLSALSALARKPPRYAEVSRFPQMRRDIAVILESAQPAGEVLDAIRKSAGRDLLSAELFDRYEGKGVPKGHVSLAFRMVFQRTDRTLTDAEVANATDRVVKMLSRRFGGTLR